MMWVRSKKGFCDAYAVFDVSYNESGYPLFLIYNGEQWVRVSAKHFVPNFVAESAGGTCATCRNFAAYTKKYRESEHIEEDGCCIHESLGGIESSECRKSYSDYCSKYICNGMPNN